MLNAVLAQIYHLKKESAVKYSRKNENIKPFESGGETSLEFFSLKTDCSIFVVIAQFFFYDGSASLGFFLCLSCFGVFESLSIILTH